VLLWKDNMRDGGGGSGDDEPSVFGKLVSVMERRRQTRARPQAGMTRAKKEWRRRLILNLEAYAGLRVRERWRWRTRNSRTQAQDCAFDLQAKIGMHGVIRYFCDDFQGVFQYLYGLSSFRASFDIFMFF
jgi:hypothetical protein